MRIKFLRTLLLLLPLLCCGEMNAQMKAMEVDHLTVSFKTRSNTNQHLARFNNINVLLPDDISKFVDKITLENKEGINVTDKNTNIYYYTEEDYGILSVNDSQMEPQSQVLKFDFDFRTVEIEKVFLEIEVTEASDEEFSGICVGCSETIDLSKDSDTNEWAKVKVTEGYKYIECPYNNNNADARYQLYITQTLSVRYKLKSITIVPPGSDWKPEVEEEKEEVSLILPMETGNTYRGEWKSGNSFSFPIPQIEGSNDYLTYNDFDILLEETEQSEKLMISGEDDSDCFTLSHVEEHGTIEEGIYKITATLKDDSNYKGSLTFNVEIFPTIEGILFNNRELKEFNISFTKEEITSVVISGLNEGVEFFFKTNAIESNNVETRKVKKVAPDESFTLYDGTPINLQNGSLLTFILGKNDAYSEDHHVTYNDSAVSVESIFDEMDNSQTRYFDLNGSPIRSLENAEPGLYIEVTNGVGRVIIKNK